MDTYTQRKLIYTSLCFVLYG